MFQEPAGIYLHVKFYKTVEAHSCLVVEVVVVQLLFTA